MHLRWAFCSFSRNDAVRLFVVVCGVLVLSVPQMAFAKPVQDMKHVLKPLDHRVYVTVKPYDSDEHYIGIVVEKRKEPKNAGYFLYTIATTYAHPYNAPCNRTIVCNLAKISNVYKLASLLPLPSCTARAHIPINGKPVSYPAQLIHERCSFQKTALPKTAQLSYFSVELSHKVPIVVAQKIPIGRIKAALPSEQ
ncbi:MAG: hypothetical protein KGO83_04045 [Paenibacillaceae bacterium]|nr:hypothetical protein [Paenibacillaceae bacterium]